MTSLEYNEYTSTLSLVHAIAHSENSVYDKVLPIFDYVIKDRTEWIVFWSGSAGLNEECDLWESSTGFNTHVDGVHQLNLHWILAGIYLTIKAAVGENFKWVTKCTKAGFSEDVVRFMVDVAVWHTGYFGILAGEAEFNLIASGDNSIRVLKRVYLIFEDHEISRVLIGDKWRKNNQNVKGFNATLIYSKKNLEEHNMQFPYIHRSATGVEGHCSQDVGLIGGKRAGGVSQLEPVLVNAIHGGFADYNADTVIVTDDLCFTLKDMMHLLNQDWSIFM